MAEAWPLAGMALRFGIRIVSGDREKVVGELDADELGGQAAGLNLPPGATTTTIESKTNFFRASPPGRLRAEAVPLHVGRRTIVVQTTVYTPDGKRAALVTQTQLVIPNEGKPAPA